MDRKTWHVERRHYAKEYVFEQRADKRNQAKKSTVTFSANFLVYRHFNVLSLKLVPEQPD